MQLEAQEHYQKNSFRNRAHIATANGLQRLSIPLKKGKNESMSIQTVEISYDENWQKQHWGAITAAYRRSPYFEYYADDLEMLFQQEIKHLFDWNLKLLKFLYEAWQVPTNWQLTTEYLKEPSDGNQDLRNQIRPKTIADFAAKKLPPKSYPQVFQEKHDFIPNLSSLDLLFCTGPEGLAYLS
ncbi:MAG: WbqC family protein [Saprospiraceae bacterium]